MLTGQFSDYSILHIVIFVIVNSNSTKKLKCMYILHANNSSINFFTRIYFIFHCNYSNTHSFYDFFLKKHLLKLKMAGSTLSNKIEDNITAYTSLYKGSAR